VFVGIEPLAFLVAVAILPTALAFALAVLASRPVATVLVLVALLADLLAGERGPGRRQPETKRAGESGKHAAARRSRGHDPGEGIYLLRFHCGVSWCMAVRGVENRLAANGTIISVGPWAALCSAREGAPALSGAPGTARVSRRCANSVARTIVIDSAGLVALWEIGAGRLTILETFQAKAAGIVLTGRFG
jgi:hypothetical protein